MSLFSSKRLDAARSPRRSTKNESAAGLFFGLSLISLIATPFSRADALPTATLAAPMQAAPMQAAPRNSSMSNVLPHDAISRHPASPILTRLFESGTSSRPAGWKQTGLTRNDYLPLVAGNVDFFKGFQNAAGAIIDPYEKRERQYSTPAFAQAAATLVAFGDRADLLEPATRAFSFSLDALVNKTTADGHADFYIPMMMHAHRILATRVSPQQREKWATQFRALVPEKTYRDTSGRGNWNIVHVTGEAMRRKDGLVAPEQADAQLAYMETSLERQKASFTRFGLYSDPNVPLAYDAFPRLWLENMVADEAYQGKQAQEILDFLTTGGLSSLLLLSPSGEWASGGRSAHHQWNEAELAVICEVNAARWEKLGRLDIAGAFKRAAHLSLTSMKRWQRPSGEMWIVKNYADPATRHGYEGYSFHSQYNLLAVAMLCIAYERADDGIPERPIPAEVGTYVFDLREKFHKIVASAGGSYVLLDTGADIWFDASGLMRIHKAGVALSPFTSNSPVDRHQGPSANKVQLPLTPGLQWKNSADDPKWHSLADTRFPAPNPNNPAIVKTSELSLGAPKPGQVDFAVKYNLTGPSMRPVEEIYRVNASGVEVTTRLPDGNLGPTRLVFPALVSDGARDTEITLNGSRATIRRVGGVLNWDVLSPRGLKVTLEGARVPTRNGYIQTLAVELPPGTREVRWHADLQPDNRPLPGADAATVAAP